MQHSIPTDERLTIIISEVTKKSMHPVFFSSWGSISVEAENTTAAFTSPK